MLIEYYASELEDRKIEHALKNYHIENWFNPEEGYYVLETDAAEIVTILTLLDIELYIVDTEQSWHEYAFGDNTSE